MSYHKLILMYLRLLYLDSSNFFIFKQSVLLILNEFLFLVAYTVKFLINLSVFVSRRYSFETKIFTFPQFGIWRYPSPFYFKGGLTTSALKAFVKPIIKRKAKMLLRTF